MSMNYSEAIFPLEVTMGPGGLVPTFQSSGPGGLVPTFQPPDEVINKENISLLFISDFIDTIKGQTIYVVKEKHRWGKTATHEPFEFKLKTFNELSNKKYGVEFSTESFIHYNKLSYHLKGYIMAKSFRKVADDDRLKKRYMFDLYDDMFTIYFPDKSIVVFNLDDPPLFVTGTVSVILDYRNYNRYES